MDPVDPDNRYFCVPLSEWEKWAKATNQWVLNGPKTYSGHGIYKSTDGGRIWQMANNGVPAEKSVYQMGMDPKHSEVLYAALNETHELAAGGLYKTTDGGTTWSPVDLPAELSVSTTGCAQTYW